jgi:DHA3 family multidrug efflux protein-like MFS transporter
MKTFYAVLANSLTASLTNMSVWFAVTFWAYLETRSVIVTAVMAGVYTLTVAVSGFFLGSLVDRYKKKAVMLLSSVISLLLYVFAGLIYISTPQEAFTDVSSPALWVFIILALVGAIAGNLRGIALATLVTILISEERRDKANGLVGTANGVSCLVASIFSGLAVGFIGMLGTLIIAIVLTGLVIVHLLTLSIPEPARHAAHPAHADAQTDDGSIDLRGTIRAIVVVPGLFALILFATFNNFLGGVYMSLMDAYGLLLIPVEVWGALWGFLSLGFIVGGLAIARKGLGKNPLRALFLANIVMWSICCVFTLKSSIVPLAIGMFVWLCLMPAVEAAEHTILQKVIPLERQGRVFGFAQSIELAAAPITAFLIGPIAQLIFIPFMTTGAGAELLGPWFGTGADRGLALLFTSAGLIGLTITLLAMRSSAYRSLSENYRESGLMEASPA